MFVKYSFFYVVSVAYGQMFVMVAILSKFLKYFWCRDIRVCTCGKKTVRNGRFWQNRYHDVVRVFVSSLVLVFVRAFLSFLYGPFCHGALKHDISTLFATFFVWTSLQFILLINTWHIIFIFFKWLLLVWTFRIYMVFIVLNHSKCSVFSLKHSHFTINKEGPNNAAFFFLL